jgi:hypothetical protein
VAIRHTKNAKHLHLQHIVNFQPSTKLLLQSLAAPQQFLRGLLYLLLRSSGQVHG